jgi:hypothetical protein
MGPHPVVEKAVLLRARITRERGCGDELAAEIRRILEAYAGGNIDDHELADWVGSWEARVRQGRDDATA